MSNVFNKDNVFFIENEIENKEEFFNIIADKATILGYIDKKEDCFNGLMEREALDTTGFQDGFAIPHCKSNKVNKSGVLFFKTNPIEWDSLDGLPIECSFVLLIPESKAGTEHLKLLSKIAYCLINDNFRDKVKAANKEEIINIIRDQIEL